MNYDKLKEELAKPEYATLSNQEAADLLNKAMILTVRNIPTIEIATWAAENGVMAGLWAAERATETPAALYGAIKTLLTVLERLDEWRIVDEDRHLTPAASQMTAGLIQAGIMTMEQAYELAAMATRLISRAEQAGLGEVLPGHVQMVREGRAF